uniref:Uncharacterized protein n=1 Tax=Arundo donax TaxID=35708 RepID=A0A0A9EK03_ARUDO
MQTFCLLLLHRYCYSVCMVLM